MIHILRDKRKFVELGTIFKSSDWKLPGAPLLSREDWHLHSPQFIILELMVVKLCITEALQFDWRIQILRDELKFVEPTILGSSDWELPGALFLRGGLPLTDHLLKCIVHESHPPQSGQHLSNFFLEDILPQCQWLWEKGNMYCVM